MSLREPVNNSLRVSYNLVWNKLKLGYKILMIFYRAIVLRNNQTLV